jgi:predicted permease
LFHRARLEHDLDDELLDYVQREIDRLIAAGEPFEEARRLALSSLHGAERVKEECRDARRVRWLEDIVSDLRFAFRTLRKAPAFTVTVIAALAFCIGLNVSIFSIVDTVLFRPLPFAGQERLVSVTEAVPRLGYPVLPFSCPDYLFVAANNHSFVSTGAYRTQEFEIAGAGFPRRIKGARLSASMFQVLGVSPAVGRSFQQKEDEHASRVVVLTDAFARSLFRDPRQALGRKVLLNRISYEVIGVMPPSFSFPIHGSRFNDGPAELFVPVSWNNQDRQQTVGNFDYSMIARLQPRVTVQQANAEVHGLIKRLAANYPAGIKQMIRHLPNFSLEAQVIPFREEFTGNVQRPLLLLLAAVGIVLLIGCSDVANLMFSRMVGRQREFALRTALGAGFGRLARQTFTEGLLLSVGGGVIGFCLALWAIPLLIHLAPDNLPRLNEVALNWRITVFVAAISLATPLFFCLAPFVSTRRLGLSEQLRGEGRTNTQSKRECRFMSAAVIVQFSLAFLLLTTAGLLLRSFINASDANPGFQPEHVVTMRISLPDSAYKTSSQVTSLFNRLLSRLSTLPGVRQAGAISELPIASTSDVLVSVEGAKSQRVDTFLCIGDALASLGVSLLKGRLLQPEDYIGKPHVAVISEGLAKRAWPHENPVGRHIKYGVDDPINNQPWLRVVGVVADLKAKLTSQSPRLAVFIIPGNNNWADSMNVLVRTSANPLSLAGAIRREMAQIDPNLPAGRMETLDRILDQSLSAERFRTWLLASFAIAAMLLATLGIAGLLAYHAAQRMQEFGVRIALGANRRNLLGLVFRHCLRLSSTGVAIGLIASLATTRILSALLYDTSPLDPATFVAVSFILTLVALAAAIIPAWRVIHADPVTSLRAE